MSANWANPEFRERMSTIQSENGKVNAAKMNSSPEIREKILQSRVLKGLSLLMFRMSEVNDTSDINDESYDLLQAIYRSSGRGGDQIPKYNTVLKHFESLKEALELAKCYNHKVVDISEVEYNDNVYDLYVPDFNNFAVDLGDNSCVFVHNCVAVHAEQNAIISASRKDMIGGTIYIVGREVSTGEYANPAPCLICHRMILNAGIERCVGRGKDGSVVEIDLKISE